MSRWRDGRRDAGLGLPELLVSIIVFGILAAAVVATMTSTLGFFRGTNARASDLNGAQVAVDAMAKALQTATEPPVVSGSVVPDALIHAGPTDVMFYAYDTPGMGPSEIRFYLNGANQLVEQRTPATGCTPPFSYGPTTQRILASGVTSGNPALFSYLTAPTAADPTGSPLPYTGSPPLLYSDPGQAGQARPTDDDIGKVALVAISLHVNGTSSARVNATGVTTTVDLVNHQVQTGNDQLPGNSC